MTTLVTFIVIAIAVLAIIASLVVFMRETEVKNRLTPLASLAFGFIMAGIFFGENRVVGYGLMGIGVILAIVDIVNRLRTR